MAPRDGSGNYTKPSGTTAVSGTSISSSAYNTLTTDFGNEITASLPRAGEAPMTGPLTLVGDPTANLQAATKQYVDNIQIGAGNIPSGVAFISGNNIISNTITATQVQTNTLTPVTQTEGAFASVASAATVDLGSQTSRNIIVTGSIAITSFGATATPDYKPFRVRFAAAITLTHNAATLICPGGQSLTLVAGDMIETVQESTGVWRVWMLTRAVTQVDVAVGAIGFNKLTNTSGSQNTSATWSFLNAMLTNAFGQGVYFNSGSPIACNLATTGLGALDTGSISPSTWYYFYGVSNGTALSILASATRPDSGGPALPAGYTYTVYIGSMRTDSSSNLLRTSQRGARTEYIVTTSTNTAAYPTIISGASGSGSAGGLTSASISTVFPPTASIGIVEAYAFNGTMGAASSNNYGALATVTGPPVSVYASNIAAETSIVEFELLSTNLFYYGQASCALLAVGWIDPVNAT